MPTTIGRPTVRLGLSLALALFLTVSADAAEQLAQTETTVAEQAARPAETPAYFVQLASLNSNAAARQAWGKLQQAHPYLLGDMPLRLQTVDLEDRGIFYRVQTGPLPNLATAKDLCWQIRAAKQDCVVVRR